jgi:uncharacterized protein YceK
MTQISNIVALSLMVSLYVIVAGGCSSTRKTAAARADGCSPSYATKILAAPRTQGCAQPLPSRSPSEGFSAAKTEHIHELPLVTSSYQTATDAVFAPAYAKGVIMAFEIHPSFSPEWAAGLRRTNNGELEAFLVEATSSIWESLNEDEQRDKARGKEERDGRAGDMRSSGTLSNRPTLKAQAIPFPIPTGHRLSESIEVIARTAHAEEAGYWGSLCLDGSEVMVILGRPEMPRRFVVRGCMDSCLAPSILAISATLREMVQRKDSARRSCEENLVHYANLLADYNW